GEMLAALRKENPKIASPGEVERWVEDLGGERIRARHAELFLGKERDQERAPGSESQIRETAAQPPEPPDFEQTFREDDPDGATQVDFENPISAARRAEEAVEEAAAARKRAPKIIAASGDDGDTESEEPRTII